MLILDGIWKKTYHNQRKCNKSQISQMNIPFKKRKLFNYKSVSNSSGFTRSGGIYYSPKNCSNPDACDSLPGMHRGFTHSLYVASYLQFDFCFTSVFKDLMEYLFK